jgi:hypothetical protein
VRGLAEVYGFAEAQIGLADWGGKKQWINTCWVGQVKQYQMAETGSGGYLW